jgi:dihydroorotase-like cyclic amidohydrolase
MKRVFRFLAVIGALVVSGALPLDAQQTAERRVLIRAGRMVDVASDAAKSDQGILVAGDRVSRVGPYAEVAASAGNAERIDLSRYTVLPGLIDAHTHVFLDGTEYANQVLKQSIPFRTIEAVTAARAALGFGFTMIRDLEKEEDEISFRRRVLHGRIDILRAELVARLREQVSAGEAQLAHLRRLSEILTAEAAPTEDE